MRQIKDFHKIKKIAVRCAFGLFAELKIIRKIRFSRKTNDIYRKYFALTFIGKKDLWTWFAQAQAQTNKRTELVYTLTFQHSRTITV